MTSKEHQLVGGEWTTLEDALDSDDNILHKIECSKLQLEFFNFLDSKRKEIEDIVSHDLGLDNGACRVGEVREWISGGNNVCMPVEVRDWIKERVIIRFPLPYKIGESQFPGNTDEKLRCEAATTIWIQEHCPDVPVPFLWAFGFSDGQTFTTPESVPFLIRLMWYCQRGAIRFFGYPLPCRYISRRRLNALKIGYLIMDYIEETDGEVLSKYWDQIRQNERDREKIFRDLARIILSLSQSPMKRIGSLTIDNRGVLSLTNRPLTLDLKELEREGIRSIDRDCTYTRTDTYLGDLIECHDNRLRHQVGSIRGLDDGLFQIATLTLMRTLTRLASRNRLQGPFYLTLTDLRPENIFIDKHGRIKSLVDMEWACALPVGMQFLPSWLTDRCMDDQGYLHEFSSMYEEFMGYIEEEEKSYLCKASGSSSLAGTMRDDWRLGRFWYYFAITSPRGICPTFEYHIRERFSRKAQNLDEIIAPYWDYDVEAFIGEKAIETAKYRTELRQAFHRSD